jgi:hypothetical protein
MSGEEAALAFFIFGGGFWVLRPLAGALARRIGGEVPPAKVPEPDEAVLSELQQLRQDVNELAERVDFTERLLAKQKESGRLSPPGGR